MPIILAFDQSITRCGVAVWDTARPVSAMRLASFSSAPETNMDTERKCEIFGRSIKGIFRKHKPDFVCWEAAEDFIRSYARKGKNDLLGETPGAQTTVSVHQLLLRDIQGQLRQSCIDWKVPWAKVAPSTWRKGFLGTGKNLGKDALKQMARDRCKALRIVADNADQAEAAGICFWGSSEFDRLQRLHSATARAAA